MQLHDRRTRESHVRFAPLFVVKSVAEPIVRQAESTGVADASIHHDDANVRAVSGIVKRVPMKLSQQLPLNPRIPERVGPGLFEVLRPERIEQEKNPYAGARPLPENSRHLIRNLPGE